MALFYINDNHGCKLFTITISIWRGLKQMMDVLFFVFFLQLIMRMSRKQHSVFFLGHHVGFQCNVSIDFIKSDMGSCGI